MTTRPYAYQPSVASDANFNFVVVWENTYKDGDGSGIFAKRYNSSGQGLGEEFQVNTYTTAEQVFPSVASDANFNFVVTWSGVGLTRTPTGIFGQRYDSSGNPLGGEFQINTYTTGNQSYGSVASDANGNFVVTWSGAGDSDARWRVRPALRQQREPLGRRVPGQHVHEGWTGLPFGGPDANGNFVVVWFGYGGGADSDIFGQRFVPPPSLSISDVSVTEGDLGSTTGVTQASFTITLAVAIAEPVMVDYATADGTATAPSDYLAKSGTLTFQPGQTSKVITVSVKGDTEVEDDETFFVNLSNPMHATIADGQGVGTILNNDP